MLFTDINLDKQILVKMYLIYQLTATTDNDRESDTGNESDQ